VDRYDGGLVPFGIGENEGRNRSGPGARAKKENVGTLQFENSGKVGKTFVNCSMAIGEILEGSR